MVMHYMHAPACEGILELITELGRLKNFGNTGNVIWFIHSMKRMHIVAADGEPPRSLLIRLVNEFTLGYTTQVPCNDPAFDMHVEVVRTDEGQLRFREGEKLLAPSEFVDRLIRLVAGAKLVP
jgi:hypothetical protein